MLPIWFRVTTRQTLWNSLTIRGTPVHVKWYSYHAGTNWILLNTHMDAMQLTINSFWPRFPEKTVPVTLPWLLVKFVTFLWQLSKSLTFPGFLDKWSPCWWHYVQTSVLSVRGNGAWKCVHNMVGDYRPLCISDRIVQPYVRSNNKIGILNVFYYQKYNTWIIR